MEHSDGAGVIIGRKRNFLSSEEKLKKKKKKIHVKRKKKVFSREIEL